MREITKTEMNIVLTFVKSPEIIYNANSVAKVIQITPMGALKALKRLEQESILKSKRIGNATTYRVNVKDAYAQRYVSFILARSAKQANFQVKRWITELNKIKSADVVVLFGSILYKSNPNDVDVLLLTDQKRFSKLKQEIKEINELNVKKIHPLYQTFRDIVKNIKERDKPILSAIKGIVIRGEEKFLDIYDESRKE